MFYPSLHRHMETQYTSTLSLSLNTHRHTLLHCLIHINLAVGQNMLQRIGGKCVKLHFLFVLQIEKQCAVWFFDVRTTETFLKCSNNNFWRLEAGRALCGEEAFLKTEFHGEKSTKIRVRRPNIQADWSVIS